MQILITGADGFIARNFRVHLGERREDEAILFTRGDSVAQLPELVAGADAVVHLAGVNRTENPEDFTRGNVDLTAELCAAIALAAGQGRRPTVIYASSTHAVRDTDYGRSKREAELRIREMALAHGIDAHIFRLPNVFGKWARPHYNSAVATFCHQISHGLPIRIDDPAAEISLVYIDDVVSTFFDVLRGAGPARDADGFSKVAPEYRASIGEIAEKLQGFRESRETHVVDRVGTGFTRALYSTYLSYLDPADFDYPIKTHRDPRGAFAEMLRTKDSGQVSFFTAGPGVTRGGHYHHSKTEKFLVIRGRARFKFRHIVTGEYHELDTDDANLRIVETVPGWTHDITNIGEDEMLVMLWANEQFDPALPDTYFLPI
jgi:UDP-2-acetamido-2,6-beta-L-arabino-hexul-4-ose reductase